MVLKNATFNNVSIILSVLLVEKTRISNLSQVTDKYNNNNNNMW